MIGLARSRYAFSLLEVMIATAILAASAMVLLSLISLGTRFGSKAETRIGALIQAQSIMDESILSIQAGSDQESYSAVLPGEQPRSYRVVIEPIPLADPTEISSSATQSLAVQSSPQSTLLKSMPLSTQFNTPSGTSNSIPDNATNPPQASELVSITVELFDSANTTVSSGPEAEPLVQLKRLVRRSPRSDATQGVSTSNQPRTSLPASPRQQ
jgi:type II secretory pathway pseudopilin PulG